MNQTVRGIGPRCSAVRRAFLDLLGRYNVSEFDDTMNLEEELRNAPSAERIE